MGVPVSQKSDSCVADLAMTDCGGSDCCDLGLRPINGGAMEQRGGGMEGPPVSPPERVPTPPASRLAGLRRFSSPGPLRCSTARSVGYEDGEDSDRYFSPHSEFSQDTSDTDSVSTSISRMYTFRLGTPSPVESPMKRLGLEDTSPPSRNGRSSQYSPVYPLNSGRGYDDVDYSGYLNSPNCDHEQNEDVAQPIDFESNSLIWYPPPPQDEGDDFENSFFEYNDDDDVDDGRTFEHVNNDCGGGDDSLGIKGKHNIAHKAVLKNELHGHFRALVSQLLQGHGVDIDAWSDIISSLAWQAATFVRPDTSKGGSMDPTDYVKVKCLASGNPNDSTFIKGTRSGRGQPAGDGSASTGSPAPPKGGPASRRCTKPNGSQTPAQTHREEGTCPPPFGSGPSAAAGVEAGEGARRSRVGSPRFRLRGATREATSIEIC